MVFANPDNQEARKLQADALEQLGYQAECATWRGFYLSGAQELRNGVQKVLAANPSSADTIAAMPVEMLLDFLSVRIDPQKAAGKTVSINFTFADGDTLALSLQNSVLNYRKNLPEKADAALTLDRKDLQAVLTGRAKLDDLVKNGKATVQGNPAKLAELESVTTAPEFWFDIITPVKR